MRTIISLASVALLSAGTGVAAASGPITAPDPVAPDGASLTAYLGSYTTYQARQLDKANAATDRWWDVAEQSRAERNQERNHRRGVQNFRRGFNALQRDTQPLSGCQSELISNGRAMLNALNRRDQAMRRANLVGIGRAERSVGVAFGRFEAAAIQAAICLAARGWQFPDGPAPAL